MSLKNQHINTTIAIVILIFVIAMFFIPTPLDKYNLYDYLKAKRLESYNQKHKEVFITCMHCKGTGERIEDINRTIFMAKVQLYLNKHLSVESFATSAPGGGRRWCRTCCRWSSRWRWPSRCRRCREGPRPSARPPPGGKFYESVSAAI